MTVLYKDNVNVFWPKENIFPVGYPNTICACTLYAREAITPIPSLMWYYGGYPSSVWNYHRLVMKVLPHFKQQSLISWREKQLVLSLWTRHAGTVLNSKVYLSTECGNVTDVSPCARAHILGVSKETSDRDDKNGDIWYLAVQSTPPILHSRNLTAVLLEEDWHCVDGM